MKISMIAASCALAATMASSAMAANTVIPGSMCNAYQGSYDSYIIRSFLGCVTTNTASTVSVIMPGIRVNQPTAQTLYIDSIGTGGPPGQLLCNAYIYPFNGGPSTWSGQRIVTCGAFNEVTYSVPANAWGYLTVFCNLPPNCRLLGEALSPG